MPVHLRHSWRDVVAVIVLSLIALALMWTGIISNAKADTPIPDNPGTYVVDQTGILSPADKQRVEKRLAQYERSRPDKPQFVVLIVKDLPDQGIERFATDTFRKWGVGQRGLDNGALEVIHPKDGNHADVRLELGRHLEGAIPDMTASQINMQVLGPLWSKGRYADGLIAVADKLAQSIDPVSPAAAESNQTEYYKQVSKPQGRGFGGWFLGLLIFAGGIALLLFLIRRERRSSGPVTGGNVKVKVEPYPYQDDLYTSRQAEKLNQERSTYRSSSATYPRPTPPSTGSAVQPPRRTGSSASSTIAAGAAGVAAGIAAEELMNRRRREREEEEERRRRRRDEDTSSYGSALGGGYGGGSGGWGGGSQPDPTPSPPSDTGYSGGGGDSGGGGSSDSF